MTHSRNRARHLALTNPPYAIGDRVLCQPWWGGLMWQTWTEGRVTDRYPDGRYVVEVVDEAGVRHTGAWYADQLQPAGTA